MRRRNALLGAAVFAAGAVVGAAVERVLYNRVLGRPDPEADEPIGAIPGETIEVTSFDGTRLHVRAYGLRDAARTIVFAHGAIETLALWHYQVRDLLVDGEYRLIAYDARGHGASGPARGTDGHTPFTEYSQCRDLVAVVEQTTSARVLLVGHSMGGMTIQALWQHGEISHIADRVLGAVFINSTYTADLRGWRGKGTRGERAFERIEDIVQRIPLTERVIDRVRPGMGDLALLVGRLAYGKQPSPRHIATSVRMYQAVASETLAAFIDLARFDAHSALGLIDVPVLVVGGTEDEITPLWLSVQIAQRVPGAELVVFEGCGHLAPFERYDELTAQLRKFADRVFA
jgi:pimeloyl-ACP methyl ester carboxylesterase